MVSYILQTRQRLSADSSRKKGGGLVTKLCLTLVTPWTVAHQTPRSMGFSRQEYWSGLPFPSPGNLPNPGIPTGGLLHYRQILDQLSHEGSPVFPQTHQHFVYVVYPLKKLAFGFY